MPEHRLHLTRDVYRTDLDRVKDLATAQGYRFVTFPDGTERCYRPDGSLAVTASPHSRTPPPPQCARPHDEEAL